MQRKVGLLVTSSLLVVLFQVGNSFGWSVPTHELLSQRAAQTSDLSAGVLKGLGFANLEVKIVGTDFEGNVKNQEIVRWIQDGAKFEDSNLGFRYRNHFHNPLHQQPWEGAGLNDVFTGDSSLLWAQSTGSKSNPNWDWSGVRSSYYNALTLPTKSEREQQFARVFAGLGHIVHLIQDVAQPAHVRNDTHFFEGIGLLNGMESWAERAERDLNVITGFAQVPLFPSLSLNTGGTPGDGIEPITEFWDTDQYLGTAGTRPGREALAVGLAEYTNANFFSEDTIASTNPGHQFPYPSVNIADYHVCQDAPPPNSLAVTRWYISRDPCPADPQQGRVDHFLAQSLLRNIFGLQPHAITAAAQLDDRVREDYARQLIPRAVGYSSGLINYFFRGQLAIEPVDQTRLRVVNLSAESLSSGTIELFYDTPQGDRMPLTTYVIASPIGPGQSTPPILFTPPTDNSNPGRYWTVFRGRLGEEDGAVIGSFGFRWVEEWDQGLTGRHPWYQTTTDPLAGVPAGSVVRTEVSGGILTQENTRPAGTTQFRPSGSFPSFQVNQSYIGVVDHTESDPTPHTHPHQDLFPLRVTPQTEFHVKVDEMSINVQPPAPNCPGNVWGNGAYQQIALFFNNGRRLEFTVPGQQFFAVDDFNPVFIPLGQEVRINVYQALQARGVAIVEPLDIMLLSIAQQFLPPCEATAEEQRQVLHVDYLRLLDVPDP